MFPTLVCNNCKFTRKSRISDAKEYMKLNGEKGIQCNNCKSGILWIEKNKRDVFEKKFSKYKKTPEVKVTWDT